MTGLALIVVGLLAFATGIIWFSTTVVRQRPLDSFPGGIGLLGMALAGIVLMVTGGLVRSAQKDSEITPQPALASELEALREQVSGQEGELAGLEQRLEVLQLMQQEADQEIAELRSLLESAEAPKEAESTEPPDLDAALVLDGPVVARSVSLTSVDYITFQVINQSQGGGAVELSGAATVVSYRDSDQGVGRFEFMVRPTSSGNNGWGASWVVGESPVLDPGERVEIAVNLTGLSPALAANKEFVIELKPASGPVLAVSRKTPETLAPSMELR